MESLTIRFETATWRHWLAVTLLPPMHTLSPTAAIRIVSAGGAVPVVTTSCGRVADEDCRLS